MKYRVLCHILVFFVCLSSLLAQTVVQGSVLSTHPTQLERNALNAVHFDLGGSGGLCSVSYERFITSYFSARVAFGSTLLPIESIYPSVTVSGFIGQTEHRGEIGFGCTPGQIGKRGLDLDLIGLARVGYRFQPLLGGFNFAITFTPWIKFRSNLKPDVWTWGGISLGWGF